MDLQHLSAGRMAADAAADAHYGGRFDVVNAFTNENQISPRLNAVFKPTETTTLHAGYARYFTPPPFELVATTTVNRFVGTTGASPGTLNDPVRAERADYFDVGCRRFSSPASGSASTPTTST